MSDTVEGAERVEPAPAGRPSRSLPRRVGEAFLRRREASVLVVAAALGALVLAELQDGMNLIGISANPYCIILGVAILVSMVANMYLSRLCRAGRT